MRFKYKHIVKKPIYKTTVWFSMGPRTWYFTNIGFNNYIKFIHNTYWAIGPPKITWEMVDTSEGEVLHE